jgi:Insulinase (Peptidase family M16)
VLPLTKFYHQSRAFIALVLIIGVAASAAVFASMTHSAALVEIQSDDFHKVYVIPNPEAAQVEVQLIVQSGEADLTGIEGQAHYVEHLAWLSAVGSTTRLADRHTNAWTTSDATGYWMTGSSADLENLLTTITKVLNKPKLDQKFAEAERGIIVREYDLRVRGNQYTQIEDALDQALYENTPYSRSLGGVPDDIEDYTVENAIAIHAQTHRPSNAMLVVYGPVSSTQVKDFLSKLTFESDEKSDLKTKSPAPLRVLYKTEQSSEPVTVGKSGLAPELVWRKIIKLKAPVTMDLLETRVALLQDILDTNLPGGIAKPLRFDAFIAQSFRLAIVALDEEYIEVRFAARPDKGVSLDQLKAEFEATLDESAHETIPKETFDRVLDRFETYWPKWDDTAKVADWIKSYTLNRAGDRRIPLQPKALQQLNEQLNRETTNSLLAAIAGPGRVRFAKIGEQP